MCLLHRGSWSRSYRVMLKGTKDMNSQLETQGSCAHVGEGPTWNAGLRAINADSCNKGGFTLAGVFASLG